MRRRENGITLIALIITLIVMLILAGVTISLTIGENGIFKKSDEGVEIYKSMANNEASGLNEVDRKTGELMNQYHGGNALIGRPDTNGIYTQNSTINGEEGSAFNPEIPKGFKPVNVGDAVWGSEEGYKKGLIIEDREANQFVWIAVDREIVKLNRYSFMADGTEKPIGEEVYATYYQELASSDKGNIVAKDINGFKTSVAEHGGYYIARYEASYGVDNKPNSKVSEKMPNKAADGELYRPTEEGQIWNNITQPNAAVACRNMYDDNYGATSDLMNSYAWDTAVLFIQKYSGDNRYSRQEGHSINSILTNTGTNGDEKCHIHDMASNLGEWITETSSKSGNPCVKIGGGCNFVGSITFSRAEYKESDARYGISFRPILFL